MKPITPPVFIHPVFMVQLFTRFLEVKMLFVQSEWKNCAMLFFNQSIEASDAQEIGKGKTECIRMRNAVFISII